MSTGVNYSSLDLFVFLQKITEEEATKVIVTAPLPSMYFRLNEPLSMKVNGHHPFATITLYLFTTGTLAVRH